MFKNFKKYSDYPKKSNVNERNICIFYYDDVTFYLRLAYIFDIISTIYENYKFYIVYPNDIPKFKEDISKNKVLFDYIIIQRNWLDLNISKLIYEKSKDLNFKIIFEIDDDLINMDKSNPGYPFFYKIKKDLEFMVKEADVVSVSTENLKNTLIHLNNNIVVIPNRLIPSWFKQVEYEPYSDNIIKIGYMGSIYHSWDLILIEDAIKIVKEYFSKKGIEIIFELIGGSEKEIDFAQRIEVPNEYKSYFEFVDWFVKIANWDIAIAPLEESNLNNAKSELKFLEYSALKIPGVYSAIGPYKQNIIHEKTGLLVYNNTTEEWVNNIIRLIENNDLRIEIIKNAYENVKNNYLIEESVNQWVELFEKNYSYGNIQHFIKSLKNIFSFFFLTRQDGT